MTRDDDVFALYVVCSVCVCVCPFVNADKKKRERLCVGVMNDDG